MIKTKNQEETQDQSLLTPDQFEKEITLRQKQIREQTSQFIIQLEQQLLDELSEIPTSLLGLKMGVLIDQYGGDLGAAFTEHENEDNSGKEQPQNEINKIKDRISNLFLHESNQGIIQEATESQNGHKHTTLSTETPSKKSLNKEIPIDQVTIEKEESSPLTDIEITQNKNNSINPTPQKNKKDHVPIQDLLDKKGFFRRDVPLIEIFNSRSFEMKFLMNK
ncbi:australin isoform a-related [Anaeramoeba flamelloides]|uniref:Australin isoform a-related n=1 Tax=Anaeramoeba flamelloides TaxID=1746091 RepID=A0AAV7Y6J9_9EUKA|nr:australin isoform a-related [Anaeramoeba flamelloides]